MGIPAKFCLLFSQHRSIFPASNLVNSDYLNKLVIERSLYGAREPGAIDFAMKCKIVSTRTLYIPSGGDEGSVGIMLGGKFWEVSLPHITPFIHVYLFPTTLKQESL
jgi:hypothetical protein